MSVRLVLQNRTEIEGAREIGAKAILGQVYLDLGLLHKAKKRTDKARKCISKAIEILEACKATVYLKQANTHASTCKQVYDDEQSGKHRIK